MGAPGGNRYAFDLKLALDAAARWNSRRQQRGSNMEAVETGQYTQAESKTRLAAHVNRLLDAVASGEGLSPIVQMARESLAKKVMAIGQLAPDAEVAPEDIDNSFVERVIGQTRDFLAVQFFDRGRAASRAVCRIVTNLPDGQSFGTGFLVTPSLLITNHHVLSNSNDAASSTAEFNYQLNDANAVLPVETFQLDPARFFLTDKDLDFALVAVAPRSSAGTPLTSFGFCPLIGSEGKIIIGQPVNVIQHPKGELKQVVVRQNKLVDLPDKQPGSDIDRYAHYEADTEPGSSGSPVFNDQWEVVALHHSGIPLTNEQGQTLDRNHQVWPTNGDPDNIDWVANEGIRASRLVSFISGAAVPGGQPLLEEFVRISREEAPLPPPPPEKPPEALEKPAPPPSGVVPLPPAAATASPAPANSVSLTVPLTITVSLGTNPGTSVATSLGAPQAFAAEPAAPSGDAAFESGKPDPDYARRPGFDPNFLGFAAPLPKLMPAVQDLAAEVGDSNELKYFHYSVIMNAARKLAFVSAVNLDVGAKFSSTRQGKDHWYYDARIPKDVQAGPALYAGNPLDFGHLTRRQDAAWGSTQDAAIAANDDTFHLTNCSPQHEVFNQSTKASHNGVLLWGNLEMYVTSQAKKGSKKLSIFNGPVFRANDAVYREVQLPKEFWKLIVFVRDDGQAGAVAFVLSQESLIRNLPVEDFVVGPYKPYQVKISDLQARTNLDFGELARFDRMGAAGPESLMEGVRAPTKAIEGFEDIVI